MFLQLLLSCLEQGYFGPPPWLRHSMVWTLDSSEIVLLSRWLAGLEVRLLWSGSLRSHPRARRLAEFATLMLVNVNRFRLPV
jgi:hypothetical protein